jgi:tRNA G18 (ribose-2'-O)-methylase SpoU
MINQKEYREKLKSSFNRSIYINNDINKFNSPKNVRSYLKNMDVKNIKKYSTNTTLGYCVLTLSICGDLNVGTIMRTSQLLGADKYIVFGKRSFDRRSAVGAMNYMNVERIFGLKDNSTDVKKNLMSSERMICPDKFYDYMNDNKLVPVFLEQRHDAIYNDNVNWITKERKLKNGYRFCFVFGNEGDGIANDIVCKGLTIPNSFVICIRQLGALQSFNVSTTVGIILSQYKAYKIKKRLDIYGLMV